MERTVTQPGLPPKAAAPCQTEFSGKEECVMDLKYEEAFQKCLVKVENTMRAMPNPPAEYAACGDGYYFRQKPYLPFEHIGTWMTSFFTGEALLAYHRTRKQEYLDWVKGYQKAYRSKLYETSMDLSLIHI